MNRGWQRALLLFSLALNVAFVSLAAVHRSGRSDAPPPIPEDLDAPSAPTPPHAGPFAPRWHARRAAALGRALALDRTQRAHLDHELEGLRPALRAARLHAAAERLQFRRALVRGDAENVRGAARAVARAQAQVDSLSAEALLREMSVLRPDQRHRWARWNLQHEPGRRTRRVERVRLQE
jgi:hypothetical protein